MLKVNILRENLFVIPGCLNLHDDFFLINIM